MTKQSAFKMIPPAAKILAAFAFTVIVAAPWWFFYPDVGFLAAIAFVFGFLVACYILLAGYVYSDASRRGMPPIPWTALAVLMPNALGFVLYFLLRRPMVHHCSACGYGVTADAAFCPRCGQPQPNNEAQSASRV